MSPLSTICTQCQRIKPCSCPDREAQRRASNTRRLGRSTRHWMRISKQARARAHGYCPDCNRPERDDDPGSKLTADLMGGGDHSRATLEQVRVRCRRCHGRADGGRGHRSLGAKGLKTRQPAARSVYGMEH